MEHEVTTSEITLTIKVSGKEIKMLSEVAAYYYNNNADNITSDKAEAKRDFAYQLFDVSAGVVKRERLYE